MKTTRPLKSLLPIAAALALLSGAAQAQDNTGTGGTILYTDANGLNPVATPAYVGGYVLHVFSTSGTLDIPIPVVADVLVVGGGGGGGMRHGGGGGGGAYVYTSGHAVSGGPTSVTVGAGGAGANSANDALKAGSPGDNSVFGTISATGGGGGRTFSGSYNGAGGSGGGGAGGGSNATGGTGTSGQGSNGGSGSAGGASGGGGGGAAAVGGASSGTGGGKGGDGFLSSIPGTPTQYAGGGGGGGDTGKTGGAAGLGGGGRGGDNGLNTNQTAGTNGTGGGGGACRSATVAAAGSNGGSGIVIVRYPYSSGSFEIVLNSPANNQTFAAGSSITATATVAQGTSYSVNFYLQTNGGGFTQVGAAGSTSPYSLNLGSLATGTYDIYATANDSVAGIATSATKRFTVDSTLPTLTAANFVDNRSGGPVESNTLVTYTVTFSKDMDANTVTVADFGNAGSAAFTIGAIAETTPGVFTVPVTPTAAGTLQLRVNAGADLRDLVGNALNTTSAIADNTIITITSDTTAPTPNPLTWATAPTATGQTSLTMTATTATDPSGVEYFFECTAGGGSSSAWQNSATYAPTGLTQGTTYSYRVRARDKSPAQSATGFSATASATTSGVATMVASTTAPVVNGLDIANLGTVATTDKWFYEDSAAGATRGQTFTTGATPVLLKAITYQTASIAAATKTYAIRVGSVSGSTFTPLRSFTATQSFAWNGGEYMTWTFTTPVLLAPLTSYGIDVGMTGSTSSWTTGIPYLNMTGNVYSGGANFYSGTLGIGTATLSNAANDRVFHLDMEHPMAPSPNIGANVPAGNLTLSWTNLSPNTGTDVWVDVWFGTNPAAMTKVASTQQNLTSFLVNLPAAATYHWRIDSYLDGAPTGVPVQSTVFNFIVTDSDGDGFPDAYELANTTPPSATALNPGDDLENGGAGDGLTNWQEFQLGTHPNLSDTDGDTLTDGPETLGVGSRPATNPTLADTDGDGLSDAIESNTGTWVGVSNTGTNPTSLDTDADSLRDNVETNTGINTSASNIGTSPLDSDSDNDNVGDWFEITASFTNPFSAASKPNLPYPLPDPDGMPGVSNKPVKVYIMSGQSNMVGFGTVTGSDTSSLTTMTRTENKFPNLVNSAGNFIPRQDVRYRGVISAFGNGPLAPGFGKDSNAFGPELGFGQVMGYKHDEPVLLLKSSIGNRSLGWDVLPPGSPSYTYGGYNYAAYGDATLKWLVGGTPAPWVTGSWYAGYEWDRYFTDESEWIHPHAAETNVVDILDNWATEYAQSGDPFPGQDFVIAGFVWWQGDKDRYDLGHATRYEQNLVRLITSLRSYYTNRYPGKVVANAPFVLGTLGQTAIGDTSSAADKAILDGMLAVDGGAGNYPQFAGNVKTVYTHPLSEGGSSNGHYNLRAGTYMLVGDALGRAMADLESVTPPGNTFANWMNSFSVAPGLAGFDQDADGDGIKNGIENFFGTAPNAFSAGLVSGTKSSNTFIFSHPQNATPATGVTAAYRWSKDLVTFRTGGQTDGDSTTVNFSPPVTNAGITTVTATVTGTATAKLFVDVKVSQN